MKPVRIAAEAAKDANEIARFIARRDPERGETYRAEIIGKALRVGDHPKAHPAREDLSPGLRAARHDRYLIFFRDLPDQVRVIRIIHSARDLKRALRG